MLGKMDRDEVTQAFICVMNNLVHCTCIVIGIKFRKFQQAMGMEKKVSGGIELSPADGPNDLLLQYLYLRQVAREGITPDFITVI